MITSMRAGRSERRRLRKKGKVLQMQFVVVNTCTFKINSYYTLQAGSIMIVVKRRLFFELTFHFLLSPFLAVKCI